MSRGCTDDKKHEHCVAPQTHIHGAVSEICYCNSQLCNRKTRSPLDVQTYTLHGCFTARRSYASVVLAVVILSVRPSVRLRVTRMLCDKTRQCTADISIPHETQSLEFSDTDSGWWAMPPSL